MHNDKISEVKNYSGDHVGMLGTCSDDRFPYKIIFYNSKHAIVCVGCFAELSNQGCLIAWGVLFNEDVTHTEINQEEGLVC